MDRILFLVNFKPWNGEGNQKHIENTYATILNIFDPDKKIEVISAYWETEAEQRNFGLDHLHKNKIDWCFIIDDDEMYNYQDLKKAIHDVIYVNNNVVYLSPHQIYWKTKNFCIDKIALALPSFCRTDRALLYFNEARAIIVSHGQTWHTFPPAQLVCHHFSYIRNDDQMERKIQNFSHADPSLKEWYKDIWLKWELDSENLHPNRDNRGSFKKAISAQESSYKLEPVTVDKSFEAKLQHVKINNPKNIHWLINNNNHSFVRFLYAFVLQQIKTHGTFKVYGAPLNSIAFLTVCEAILMSGQKDCCEAHDYNPGIVPDAYKDFLTVNGKFPVSTYDLAVLGSDQHIPKSRYIITSKLENLNYKHYFKFSDNIFFVEM